MPYPTSADSTQEAAEERDAKKALDLDFVEIRSGAEIMKPSGILCKIRAIEMIVPSRPEETVLRKMLNPSARLWTAKATDVTMPVWLIVQLELKGKVEGK